MMSHDLAKLLLENPNVELIMQKDSEGNGYSPLSGIDFNIVYKEDSSWDGVVYDTRWTANDADMEEDEWDELKKSSGKHAVLYPVN